MSSFTAIDNRHEWQVLHHLADGRWEVLYRTRPADRIPTVLSALDRAWDRGVAEKHRGWPEVPCSVSPMFETQAFAAGIEIVERSPKGPQSDAVIYQTSSEVDAQLVMAALRRAATLGAMSVT